MCDWAIVLTIFAIQLYLPISYIGAQLERIADSLEEEKK